MHTSQKAIHIFFQTGKKINYFTGRYGPLCADCAKLQREHCVPVPFKEQMSIFFFSFLYSDPSCYFSISAVIFRLTEKAKLGEASAKDGEEVPRLDNASLYAVPETNCANTTATVQ